MSIQDFHRLTEAQFQSTSIEEIILKKGQTLFQCGDQINYIYFVEKGHMNVFKDNILIWQAGPEDFLGITSLFLKDPSYSYTVTASKSSKLIKIKSSDFESRLQHTNNLKLSLLKLLNKRINLTLQKTLS